MRLFRVQISIINDYEFQGPLKQARQANKHLQPSIQRDFVVGSVDVGGEGLISPMPASTFDDVIVFKGAPKVAGSSARIRRPNGCVCGLRVANIWDLPDCIAMIAESRAGEEVFTKSPSGPLGLRHASPAVDFARIMAKLRFHRV